MRLEELEAEKEEIQDGVRDMDGLRQEELGHKNDRYKETETQRAETHKDRNANDKD